MSLHIYSIPRLHDIKKQIANKICKIPIKYSSPPASFGMAENFKGELLVNSWYTCREVLHDNYPISNHLFITHNAEEYSNLVSYIVSMENKLQIENPSVVTKTIKKTSSCIMLSKFWKKKLRFTLLTMILRFAILSKKRSFKLDDLLKCKHLSITMPALELFFSGKKTYKGRKSSWYEQFKNLNLQQSSKYLG